MKYGILFCLFLYSSILYGQTFNAAPFQAIGNTGIALTSIYSITNNPAGLTGLQNMEVAIAYQPNFVSSEISTQAMYIAIPIKIKNVFGIGMHRYGLATVSSLLTISTAYARSFGDIFSSSVSINYHSFSVKNYGRDQTFSVDLGIQFSVLEELTIGAIFRNISTEMFVDDIEQYIPKEIGLGAKYIISGAIFLSSDVYYDAVQQLNLRGGVSYSIDKLILLRAGASSGPFQYFAGIGLAVNKFSIDCSSSFHPRLGTSPQLALAYVF